MMTPQAVPQATRNRLMREAATHVRSDANALSAIDTAVVQVDGHGGWRGPKACCPARCPETEPRSPRPWTCCIGCQISRGNA